MEGITTYGQVPDKVGVQGVQRLLSVFLPQVLTQRWAQTDEAKSRSGNTVKWRRYHNFVVDSAGIAENTTGNPVQLQKSDFFAVLQKFVIWTELTEECVTFNEDNILDVAISRVSEGLAQKIELFTIDILKAGTNAIYCGGTTRGTVARAVNVSDLQLAVRVFNRNDGQPITKMIPPSTSVATAGVRAGFIAMCHTDLIPDLENIRGFKKVVEYGNPGSGLECEIGEAAQVRFFATRNFTPWLASGATSTTMLSNTVATASGAADVYPIIVVAKDAYAVVRLTGRKSVDLKVRQPNGTPDSADPTASKGSVAGKMWYAAARTCEEWICRIESTCTATPAA